MRAGRQRTESMAQRLAKKPVSEGFELWDKGYALGAMRLFIFKAENSPPFHLGPILDAMAHLLAEIGEAQDAKENFQFAAEKYDMIQQPVVAKLMTVKGTEAVEGPNAALPLLNDLIAHVDAGRQAPSLTDAKLRTAIARAYHYRAALLAEQGHVQDALNDATYAVQVGNGSWDRIHLAFFTLGEIQLQLGNEAGAVESLTACLAACPHYLKGYEQLIPLVRADTQRSLNLLSRAIDVHPRAHFIRQKAFVLSDEGCDAEALEMLDSYIANPPHEEMEAFALAGNSVPAFHKAKAAILADAGRKQDALAAAHAALALVPGDEEATKLIADISTLDG